MNKSIMWKYIDEEESVLLSLLARTDIMEKCINLKYTNIYFVAHGSSYNATQTLSGFIAKWAKCKTYCYTPGNFLYNCNNLEVENHQDTLVLAISQTGNSSGTLQAAKKAQKLGFKVLSITDSLTATLAKQADYQLDLQCQLEDSNAKTKGYSATLMMLMLIGIYCGKGKGIISEEQLQLIKDELTTEVKNLKLIKTRAIDFINQNKIGHQMTNMYFLGNGMNFGSSLEGQIKLMETMCMPTLDDDVLEFSHGMHRSINSNCDVLIIKTPDDEKLVQDTFDYLDSKGAKTYLINTLTPQQKSNVLNIPYYQYSQSIFSIVLIIQLISVMAPEYNQLDPNRDANNDFTSFVNTRV